MVVVSVLVLSRYKPAVSASGLTNFLLMLHDGMANNTTMPTPTKGAVILLFVIGLMCYGDVVKIIVGGDDFMLAHSLMQTLEHDKECRDNHHADNRTY